MFHKKESNDYNTHKNSKKSNSTLTMLKYVEMRTVTANDENNFKMYIFPVFVHHFFSMDFKSKICAAFDRSCQSQEKTQDFIQKTQKIEEKHTKPHCLNCIYSRGLSFWNVFVLKIWYFVCFFQEKHHVYYLLFL